MSSSVASSVLSNPDSQLHRLLTKRPRFVFLDAVNTLMDLEPDFPGFFIKMARREGVECDPAFVKEALERSRQRVRVRLAGRADFSISQERERTFWRSIDSEIFREMGFGDRGPEIADKAFAEFESGRHFRLLDETVPALRRLRELGFPIGIVSNGTEGMERWMRGCAFAPFMEFIFVSVGVGWEKPGPEIFRLALERAGVEPREALHVGDSFEHDILGAAGVGIPGLWVSRNGATHPECPSITHIGELPDWLEGMANRG